MRSDFNCNMQKKHSKCIIFLICLQFSIINILYANTIWSPSRLFARKSCRLACICWQFFQPVIWRVADLPAFAFDAFRQKSVGRTSNSWRLCKWVMLLVTVYRERAFDKQSSSKIMCDKTQSISNINVFQQPLQQRRDWLRCSWTWPKDKTNSTCYFSIIHYIVISILFTLCQTYYIVCCIS
jgi:hypothetical protein